MSAAARVIRLEIADEIVAVKDIDTLIDVMEKRIPHREVMHRKEAADFIGIHVRTLDRLANDGAIPSHRLPGLDGTRLYLRSELVKAIEKH